jgi:hypothetical protein
MGHISARTSKLMATSGVETAAIVGSMSNRIPSQSFFGKLATRLE